MDSTLIIYVGLTMLVLYSAALQLAPTVDESLQGCQVSYVYDGDTVALSCPDGEETARLMGFDTPETNPPGCVAEAELGVLATRRLRALVAAGDIELIQNGREKYGRLLVSLRVAGRDVGQILIREGLAVPYRGGRRTNWCDGLE